MKTLAATFLKLTSWLPIRGNSAAMGTRVNNNANLKATNPYQLDVLSNEDVEKRRCSKYEYAA